MIMSMILFISRGWRLHRKPGRGRVWPSGQMRQLPAGLRAGHCAYRRRVHRKRAAGAGPAGRTQARAKAGGEWECRAGIGWIGAQLLIPGAGGMCGICVVAGCHPRGRRPPRGVLIRHPGAPARGGFGGLAAWVGPPRVGKAAPPCATARRHCSWRLPSPDGVGFSFSGIGFTWQFLTNFLHFMELSR